MAGPSRVLRGGVYRNVTPQAFRSLRLGHPQAAPIVHDPLPMPHIDRAIREIEALEDRLKASRRMKETR